MTQIVTIADLKAVTGYKRLNDIENWLIKNGVRYLPCKSGLVTTTDALNSAMGLEFPSYNPETEKITIL